LDEPGESPYVYETNVLAVRYVPHFAESRTGFHFIDTNEFALYRVFFAADRDEPYRSYYRSDRKFEAEIYLDDLHINEHI
jgi:hypothetical protein